MNAALKELLSIRGMDDQASVHITGQDPVFSTRFKVAETAAAVLGATGLAISDIWEMKTGRRQEVSIDVEHAAAAISSHEYLEEKQPDGSFRVKADSPLAQDAYNTIKAYETKDGRWYLPHFGMSHMKKKVLGILECEMNPDSIAEAVAKWNAEDLDEAIAAVNACGGIARTQEEWLAHPHGQALAAQAVVEITKIGDSDPEPFPEGGRALEGIRVLDLTRILAGPVAARTFAEQGADVLMVAAQGVPQIKKFVMDLSHGKRSCFLDLKEEADAAQMRELVKQADVFSQGYRPGALSNLGFGPEELAALRPGIIYTSIDCYGKNGPFSNRAGWEQVAQTVTGISAEHGSPPELLPVYICDYMTGYLGAYGTLLALARRAREGGSYQVNVSLCQSAMFLQRQGRVEYPRDGMGVDKDVAASLQMVSDTSYGQLKHLGPVVRFSETTPKWDRPTPALGGDKAEWL